MTMNKMGGHMDNAVTGEKMKKKTFSSLICSLIVNAVMAGIYGWFALPHGNLDTYRLWAERTAERDAFADTAAFTSQYPTEKD
jgi:hypothetical protein